MTNAVVPKYKPLPTRLPTARPQPIAPTSKAEIDKLLTDLSPQEWVSTSPGDRAKLVEEAMWNLIAKADTIAQLSTDAKGSYGQGMGEELASMFPIVLGMKEYAMSLKAGGQCKPVSIRKLPGRDQLAVKVFPHGMLSALLPGYVGEVYIQPGQQASQGGTYRRKASGVSGPGGVALVLGAGNQYSVALLDILHKLLVDDEVVVCKMSPVNEYLGPVWEEALRPFTERGALAIVYGGKEEGEYLTSHPRVTSVHLTGSTDTCNAILWGSPTTPRVGNPPLNKAVTAELGNVTPLIIVPGPWSDSDIDFHVRNIVASKTHNAGHNCVGGEVIVTDRSWPLRDKFLAALKQAFNRTPQRYGYYPGTEQKVAQFRAKFQPVQVQELGVPTPGTNDSIRSSPWLLVEGLSEATAQCGQEHWAGVMQEVALEGQAGDPEVFLSRAVEFCNTQCWGSLCAGVWVHPETKEQLGGRLTEAILSLRYGSISINSNPMLGYAVTGLPWGAAPGNTVHNVESGLGFVHNTFLLDHPQKGVMTAPWRPAVTPLANTDNYGIPYLMPKLIRLLGYLDNPLMAMPSMLTIPLDAVRS